jgi:hypothetical protein
MSAGNGNKKQCLTNAWLELPVDLADVRRDEQEKSADYHDVTKTGFSYDHSACAVFIVNIAVKMNISAMNA